VDGFDQGASDGGRAGAAGRLLQHRASPSFFITDRTGTTLSCTTELIGNELIPASMEVLSRCFDREEDLQFSQVVQLDDLFALRIVPLSGKSDHFAVFIERLNGRDPMRSIRRFRLTHREAEVFRLLVRGNSNPQIAQQLMISEGTVGDHVKAVFRKTSTRKRSELVARVFNAEHEPHGGSGDGRADGRAVGTITFSGPANEQDYGRR
jgi:DNA-binding CsgD family transcriptional regulator